MDDEQVKRARELFETYTALLNQEFHNHDMAEKVGRECIAIADQLLDLDFIILAAVTQSTEIMNPSDETMRIIFTFAYEFALIPHQIPVWQIVQPVAFSSATSKVFGPLTIQENHTLVRPRISARNEAWLHSILDNLAQE